MCASKKLVSVEKQSKACKREGAGGNLSPAVTSGGDGIVNKML